MVGLFLLSKLQHLQMNHGLYRDDLLGVTELKGKEPEKLKQDISKVFKAFGLTVKVEVNKKVVNYLNVTLDGSHRDYMKPGQVIKYVHVNSNHPPCVKKSIGQGVNHRLSANSSSKAMFDAAKGPYQEALERSGHKHKLVYEPVEETARISLHAWILSRASTLLVDSDVRVSSASAGLHLTMIWV